MPSLRFDALTGRHVLVAPGRSQRPNAFARPANLLPVGPDPCPFCPGHEDLTPPETGRVPPRDPDAGSAAGPAWRSRAFPNLHPMVEPDGSSASGCHEVVVVSPDHDRDLVRLSPGETAPFLDLARRRVAAHAASSVSVLFVNHGRRAGASLPHPHAQLVSTVYVPPLLTAEQEACAREGACPVCDDVARRDELVVATHGDLVAWCPPAPSHPHEIRVAPRDHDAGWDAVTVPLTQDLPRLLGGLERAAGGAVAYNVVWHAGMPGLHPHVHLWAATSSWAGFEHGTGLPVVATDPVVTAAAVRAASLG